jgi:hypothetical protein
VGFDLVTPLAEESLFELAAEVDEDGGGGAIKGQAQGDLGRVVAGGMLHGAS